MNNVIFIDGTVPFGARLERGLISAGLSEGSLSRMTACLLERGKGPKVVSDYLSRNGVGSFAIVSKDAKEFSGEFPNNTIEFDPETGDWAKLGRQIAWMFTDFGRDTKDTSRVFLTSDTHFFHQNIIRYCDRPWKTAEEMNDALVERWNSTVGRDDLVYHLGDFSFGGREKVESAFRRLNGRICLVLGNHDRLKVRDYYDIGFHRVYDRPILVQGFFLLSHAPIQWVKDGGAYANIYGHVHDMEMYRDFTRNTACVCVERTDYAPVRFDDIVAKMESFGGGGQ